MRTQFTFPYAVLGVTDAILQSIVTAADLTNFTIGGVEVQANIVTITANRLLTDSEKTSAIAAFHAMFPLVVDLSS